MDSGACGVKTEMVIKARLKRFIHLIAACYRLDGCRAVTIWNESHFGFKRETLVIGCDCGKIFYCKDEASEKDFHEFIKGEGKWDRKNWEKKP